MVGRYSKAHAIFVGAMAIYALSGIFCPACGDEKPEFSGDWRVAAYVGQFTETRFHQILTLHTRFRDSYVGALAVSRTLASIGPKLDLDGEVQVARHWGEQHHAELNAALMLRWKDFPWNSRFSTTVAMGLGPSFATSTPDIETERHERTSRELVFMPFEITAGRPDRKWETFIRIHHRSGAFDQVSRGGGSNLVATGFRLEW